MLIMGSENKHYCRKDTQISAHKRNETNFFSPLCISGAAKLIKMISMMHIQKDTHMHVTHKCLLMR